MIAAQMHVYSQEHIITCLPSATQTGFLLDVLWSVSLVALDTEKRRLMRQPEGERILDLHDAIDLYIKVGVGRVILVVEFNLCEVTERVDPHVVGLLK